MDAKPTDKPKVETKALTPVAEVFLHLEKRKNNIEEVLRNRIPSDTFIQTIKNAITETPELANVDRSSLWSGCMKAAADGLMLDGREAALVIFSVKNKETQQWEKKAQYMPMIAGIFKKVRNSGEVSTMSAQVVYENDDFLYREGTDPKLEHIPLIPLIPGQRGDKLCVYAVAKMKDGNFETEVMSIEAVEEIRACAKTDSIWKKWWGEMAKKTVLHRLAKRLPMSTELARVFEAQNDMYDLNKPDQPEQSREPLSNSTHASRTILEQDGESIDNSDAVDVEFEDAGPDVGDGDNHKDPI